MQAFHHDIAIKEKYLFRVKAHRLADEIIQGTYWQNGRGCAIGCTIHGNNHYDYENQLGIPRELAILEDGIFESLPLERAKLWPEQFLSVINVGANLSSIWPKFASWLLTDSEHGVIKFAKTEEQKKVIQKVSDLYKNYENVELEEWEQMNRTAAAAAYAAAVVSYGTYASAANAAKQQARIIQADKLLQLLSECK